MRNKRSVEFEVDSDRTSIAKSPTGRDRDEYASIFGCADRGSVCVGYNAFRIEKRTVEIECEEFYNLASTGVSLLRISRLNKALVCSM